MYSHLSMNDRLIIERMLKKGYSKKSIADAIGCCLATIYNEIKRGKCTQLNSSLKEYTIYSPEKSEYLYHKYKSKGFKPKILSDKRLQEHLRHLIVDERLSPKAALLKIKTEGLKFSIEIKSVNTIYKAIRDGNLPGVKMCHLVLQGRKRKKVTKVHRIHKKAPANKSIEDRDEEILNRNEFGHWEMDTVFGKINNKKTLLVLTERKTRYEIIEVLKSKSIDEVRKALNRVEKRYGYTFYHIFKSITVDNGSEFKGYESIEKALYRKGNRTNVYYCHPNCPSERGSNENNNKFIRRYLPKGSDFDKLVTRNKIKKIEAKMNAYPREIFAGYAALHQFTAELKAMGFT
ncbi:MAG: IS30 family transposase [Peptostreptococcaceae bacterium]|nr:IS30 family transposase [Peptostreptococcaceae bacterium]MDY5739260.1 IS30 family transposase [Anaerovoracaceae bacterium]